jgi:hypothetical protein
MGASDDRTGHGRPQARVEDVAVGVGGVIPDGFRMQLARRRRVRRPGPGRVTVEELARRGLGQYPAAVAIYWPDDQVVVCRDHVTGRVHRQLMVQLRPATDEAKLLMGGSDTAAQLRRQCVHCQAGPG